MFYIIFCSEKIDIYIRNSLEKIVYNWISQVLMIISESWDILFLNGSDPSLNSGMFKKF